MRRFAGWIGLACLVAMAGVVIDPGPVSAQQTVGQWKGLVPGRSMLNDVYVALGRPTKTLERNGLTHLFWPPTMPPGKKAEVENMVVASEGVVQYIMVADAADLEPDPFKLVAQMGKPQGVTQTNYSSNSSYYHYPLRGVSFLVDAGPGHEKDTVVYKMIYAPTDWTTLQANFPWARPKKPDFNN